jgi:hypothetical protein
MLSGTGWYVTSAYNLQWYGLQLSNRKDAIPIWTYVRSSLLRMDGTVVTDSMLYSVKYRPVSVTTHGNSTDFKMCTDILHAHIFKRLTHL